MPDGGEGMGGTPLRNSLWNLLYRVVSSNDHSRTAWGAILRGSCLAFFKRPIDDLPSSDNDASRRKLKEIFFFLKLLRMIFLMVSHDQKHLMKLQCICLENG